MHWLQEFKKLIFSKNTSTEQINKAISIKYENIPRTLYKYRAINNYSLNNLEDNSIWLSDPKKFNDPYDTSFHYKVEFDPDNAEWIWETMKDSCLFDGLTEDDIQSVLENEKPTVRLLELSYPNQPEYGRFSGEALHQVLKDRANKLVRETAEGCKQMFKICCFSEDPKSILMWSHYAASHTGFCIGYDFYELGKKDLRSRSIFPVIYSDERFDATDFFGKNPNTNNILYLHQAALMKSTQWSYEKEWRLVFGNMIIQKEMSFRVPKPKHVLLGKNISAKNETRIKRICESKDIEVYKMEMKNKRFALEIKK